MIHLVTRGRHQHSGMQTFAAGLSRVSEGKVQVVDIREADRLRLGPADLVIFDDQVGADGSALVAGWKVTAARIGVLVHSPLLQMDVSNELKATIAMFDSQPLDLILAADEELSQLLRRAQGRHVVWLPHCVPKIPEPPRRRAIDAGNPPMLWMPMTLPDDSRHYRHKNAVCQLAGAALYDGEVELATNTASDRLRQTARWLSVPLREVGHVPQEQFDSFLASASVGMCVSLAESFCYNAVEMMLRGVPVLFGPALTWAWRSPELVALCGVTDPGSAVGIATRLHDLLSDQARYEAAVSIGYEVALTTIERHHREAHDLLRSLDDEARADARHDAP